MSIEQAYASDSELAFLPVVTCITAIFNREFGISGKTGYKIFDRYQAFENSGR